MMNKGQQWCTDTRSNNIILITLCSTGDLSNPRWDVYGHRGVSYNDSLGSFDNRIDALLYCHTFNVPVFEGSADKTVIQEFLASDLHKQDGYRNGA